MVRVGRLLLEPMLKVSLLVNKSHETVCLVLSSVHSALLMASLNTKASLAMELSASSGTKKLLTQKRAVQVSWLIFPWSPPIYGQYRSLPPTIPCANPIYFRFFRDWQQTYQFTEWSENCLSRFQKITITQRVSPESPKLLHKSDFSFLHGFEMLKRHVMTQTEAKKLNVVTMTS